MGTRSPLYGLMANVPVGNAVLFDRAQIAGFARLLLLLDQLVHLRLQR